MLKSFFPLLLIAMVFSVGFVNSVALADPTPNCVTTSTTCVEPGSTKVIDGVSVHEDCWAYQEIKRCTYPAANNCKALQEKGCRQIASECALKIQNICVVQNQTYQCPIKTCGPSDNLICGREQFCMDDHCAPQRNEQSADFNTAVSRLAAVSASADSVKGKNPQPMAFTGKAYHCKKTTIITTFDNCCQRGGWGTDLGLTHCTAGEKKLGASREKGLTVYVGKYYDGILKAVEHKVYCVFPSKIGQIIQAQGRYQQLHINFGDAKHPNCRGVSPEELQHMNFSAMDFSDIVDAIKSNLHIPDQNQLEQQAINRVKSKITGSTGVSQ